MYRSGGIIEVDLPIFGHVSLRDLANTGMGFGSYCNSQASYAPKVFLELQDTDLLVVAQDLIFLAGDVYYSSYWTDETVSIIMLYPSLYQRST